MISTTPKGQAPIRKPYALDNKQSGRSGSKAVAISFWILAPYVAIGSVRDLITQHHADSTLLGIGLTISSIVLMPALGIAKQRLGVRLGLAQQLAKERRTCSARTWQRPSLRTW